MASELALRICMRHLETTVTVGAARLAANVDAEIQETRTVLIQTADWNILPHGPCWCRKDLTDDNEPHNEFCLRARALWARLKVK